MQGYPEGYWPQPPYSLSQEKLGEDVRGEVKHHAGLAEYDTQYDIQMYSTGPYEQNGVGGSSKSCPAQSGRQGLTALARTSSNQLSRDEQLLCMWVAAASLGDGRRNDSGYARGVQRDVKESGDLGRYLSPPNIWPSQCCPGGSSNSNSQLGLPHPTSRVRAIHREPTDFGTPTSRCSRCRVLGFQ